MRRFLILLALACTNADALELTALDEVLVLSGDIKRGDAELVSKNLEGVSTVILKDSDGGDLRDALMIGNELRAARITTVVSGYCFSACAMIFLGGVERQLQPTSILGFHGSSPVTTAGARYNDYWDFRMLTYSVYMTGQGIPFDIAKEMFYTLKQSNMMIFQGPGKAQLYQDGLISDRQFTALSLKICTQ